MTQTETPDKAQSPRDAGYAMPAEWEPHTRCWMAWPHRVDLVQDLERTQHGYAAVARAIARFEPVTMVATPEAADVAGRLCGPGVEILPMPIDDAWARDSGPTFLKHRETGALAGTSWRFNAWGVKHEPYDQDDLLAGRILDRLGAPCFQSPLFLEGGALHVDGEGTVLTTESCVLNANRNPGWSKEEAEREILRALGAETLIWLPGDPDEKETDGHVDGLACFVRPGVVLMETARDRDDPYHAVLAENRRVLESAADAKGRRLEILPIEYADEAEPTSDVFCGSYINFYLANGAVILPGYGVPGDQRARDTVAAAFPGRTVVQVDVTAIAPGGGAIHCITQQQPA